MNAHLVVVPFLLAGLCAQERTAPPAAPAEATAMSKDGTRIAYEKSGSGPIVILVSCALADRTGASRLAQLLAPRATVINYDRRGRGRSGDGKRYEVQREVEDIEALIDANGGTASLFGSSSGAVLALTAANALTEKVAAIALFEPPFVVDDSRPPIPADMFTRIRDLVEKDHRSGAVALFMSECLGVPAEMLEGMKQAPMWRGLEKLAHTIPYDGALLAGLQAGKPLPAHHWPSVTARTLVVDGENSDLFLHRAADALVKELPGAGRKTLAGQDHSVVFTAPQAIAPVLLEFLVPSTAATTPAKGSDKR